MPWVAGLSVRVLSHEGAHSGQKLLVDALTELVQRQHLAGITVTRAIAGLSDHSGFRTAGALDLGNDMPLVIEIVDRLDRIEPLLPQIATIVTSGVLTVADVRLYFPASHLRVRDVMQPARLVVREDEPLARVVRALLEEGVRLVPVVAADGTLRGIITLSYLLQHIDTELAAHLADPTRPEHLRLHLDRLADGKRADACMLAQPRVVHTETALDAAGRMLTQNNITRAPVVTSDRHVTGILGEHDIATALLEPPQPTAGEHVAALHMGIHPAAGAPLTAESLVDRTVPVIPQTATAQEVVHAVYTADEPLALVVDENGRLRGLIDEHALLSRAIPGVPAGIGAALSRFFSRSSAPLHTSLAQSSPQARNAVRAGQLAEPVAATVPPDASAADALARMIAPPGSDFVVVTMPDGRPVGVLWRQTALQALVGG